MKTGYKQTEVGIIPNEWDVVAIGSLIFDYRGGASLRPSDFTSMGVKVLPKGGVGRTGWLNVAEDEQKYCSPEYAAVNYRNQVDKSYTIIVLRDLVPSGPSIGLIVQIRDDETYVLAQGVYGFKVNEKAVPGYLVHLSNTSWYRKMANSIMVGSTQVHITNTAYKKVLIPLPPLPEQEAIAEALSDADALIEALEQLLAKKRHVKQGAMQELLTGKRRLPGFNGVWKAKILRTITRVPITDGPHLTPRFLDDGIPFLSVNNLVDNKIDLTDLRHISLVDHLIFSRKCKPQRNDILFGKAASVGKVAIVEMDLEFDIWSPIALIRINNDHDPKFVYYIFQTKDVIRQIEILTNSSSQGNISMADIEKLVLPLPSKAEQTAIAEILGDMDAEIAELEGKLSKARQVKQGMMSVLLTGKVRLV